MLSPSARKNIVTRLRMVRAALTRPLLYKQFTEIGQDFAYPVDDAEGTLEPFTLMRRALGQDVCAFPDFATRITPSIIAENDFTRGWTSEPSVSLFLGRLAVARKVETIIEIGCFGGWTTSHFALALEFLGRGKVHYVDCVPENLEHAKKSLASLQLTAFAQPYLGYSIAPELLAAVPAKADLIFIDTTHTLEDTLQEVELYAPRLNPGGCLALHDSIKAGGVRRAVHAVREQFEVATFATERGNGLSVLFPRGA